MASSDQVRALHCSPELKLIFQNTRFSHDIPGRLLSESSLAQWRHLLICTWGHNESRQTTKGRLSVVAYLSLLLSAAADPDGSDEESSDDEDDEAFESEESEESEDDFTEEEEESEDEFAGEDDLR